MSHRITVEGNFGSAEALKTVLDREGVAYSEKEEGGETWLTFNDGRYNRYGNALRICLTNPRSSTMDADIGRTVRGWYRDAMCETIKQQLLMNGHSITEETRQGQNIVLRVAVG